MDKRTEEWKKTNQWVYGGAKYDKKGAITKMLILKGFGKK